MSILFEILILIFFVFFSSYFPGRITIERLNLSEQEKFVLSFGISCFLFYIFGFLSYVLNISIFNGFFLLILLLFSIFFLYKTSL
ncbi:MAG: hypothetical protein NC833_04905 [Candidatus Omnitrophica bacterium]|nr:hypothetical protein [Candidatus Omnitrophota bacterium]